MDMCVQATLAVLPKKVSGRKLKAWARQSGQDFAIEHGCSLDAGVKSGRLPGDEALLAAARRLAVSPFAEPCPPLPPPRLLATAGFVTAGFVTAGFVTVFQSLLELEPPASSGPNTRAPDWARRPAPGRFSPPGLPGTPSPWAPGAVQPPGFLPGRPSPWAPGAVQPPLHLSLRMGGSAPGLSWAAQPRFPGRPNTRGPPGRPNIEGAPDGRTLRSPRAAEHQGRGGKAPAPQLVRGPPRSSLRNDRACPPSHLRHHRTLANAPMEDLQLLRAPPCPQ
ncbi:hypothetical protein GGR56DRAFT_533974 [Xylariaceae sp. FL0804]|nr:hypothetical protein GGR56DRAFT_533974 [Xylariaceae sp. FL0804]